MTTTRDHVLARVRRNQPAWRELPQLPSFARRADGRLEAFAAALKRMGGSFAAAPAGALDAFVRARFPDARVICSATPEVAGTRSTAAVRDPRELADVEAEIGGEGRGVAKVFVEPPLQHLVERLVALRRALPRRRRAAARCRRRCAG